ncbi:hypothetical protein [Methanogenium organophilum]|uniref:Uncharacterized protein n=1 Tax=Methanogenium organophilum TaxID=2199 RepID=A0A9X9T7V1_METOG|nr:hypothetical protein [Methanogenium organophilum]WAI00791.1 hypothetical protein OU421_10230 [Methanogenium organophilum]
MQLPRGTLHSIKKDIVPSQLFKEFSEKKFTGHCNLYINSDIASTVFREGRCILAKTGKFCGFDAYKRIEMDPSTVSAELYTFTETQLSLSNEFNPGCTVVFPKKEPLQKIKTENSPINESKIMAEVKRQQISEESIRPDSTDSINTIFEFRPAVNPKIRKPKREFQLPRGKFITSQTSITLLDAVRTAEENNFSGYMIIEMGIRKASIIYRNGLCIMIDYPPKYGEEAIQEIQKNFEKNVNAETYDLSQHQMDLALEFNEGYWANNWTKGTGVSITSISREIIEVKDIFSEEKSAEESKIPESKQTIPEEKPPELPPVLSEEPTPESQISEKDEDDEELDDFAQEVNRLENMDMELMESRVRENFRDVIRELDLDYLISDAKNEKKRAGNINE